MRELLLVLSLRHGLPGRLSRRWLTSLLLLGATGLVNAEEEKPRASLCLPLAVPAGATTRVLLRGWALERVDEVRCDDPLVSVSLVGRGEAAVPNPQDLARIGNRQLELDVTVAAERAPADVSLQVFVAGHPEGNPCRLLVGSPHATRSEEEPNEGFRSARPISFPQVVDGTIQGDRDVDVFALELAESRLVRMELRARSQGSALDGLVTVFDGQGRRVVEQDDRPGLADPRMELTLTAGRYFIVVQDALDRGGPGHAYRLLVEPVE